MVDVRRIYRCRWGTGWLRSALKSRALNRGSRPIGAADRFSRLFGVLGTALIRMARVEAGSAAKV